MRVKAAVVIMGLCVAGAAAAQEGEPAAPLPGYALAWADEFNVDGLPDRSKWVYDTHANRTGWYNDELQYYSPERAENARVEDGRLLIEARRERLESAPDFGGQNYTSSRMVIQGVADWTYGMFEARMKLPCGRGAWPAFWMLPTSGDWPGGGEIDVMEHVGHEPDQIYASLHTLTFNHAVGTGRTGQTTIADACEAFHTYQVEWTPELIRFFVDGAPYYEVANDQPGGRDAWPFDAPFYLILNVAVGGTWGGAQGVDETIWPRRLEVDWVRVWQRDE